MALNNLAEIKKALRITHNSLDTVLQADIDTAELDIQRVGVINYENTDKLILKVVELYVKWQENYEGQADRYQRSYEMMRDGLAMCGEYNTED